MTVPPRPRRAHQLRRRPLRAGEPGGIWDQLDFSSFELRATALTSVLLGVAFASTATTFPGGLGMFGLGALMGCVFGFRVSNQYLESGRIFRGTVVLSAAVIAVVDVATIVGWVF